MDIASAEAIDPKDYTYSLAEERIAKYPKTERGTSKLLLSQQSQISHHTFNQIPKLLPAESLLVFNNTKVIPARLIFQKETGAVIEIFLLEPIMPSRVMTEAMGAKRSARWKCMVGNAKKWKDGIHLNQKIAQAGEKGQISLSAKWGDRIASEVIFTWDDQETTFAEIIQGMGQVPLPPYIDRKAETEDEERYQTVYSKVEGAVAAPTAGLHFTEEILGALDRKGIRRDEVTLHVSAGTFQPLKVTKLSEHPMHSEQVVISKENIENLVASNFIVAVGTTSMRTLESLYWYGVMLLEDPESDFLVKKLYPYQKNKSLPSKKESLTAVLDKMRSSEVGIIVGQTEIFIFPGYQFQICQGLVTNFHLPGSTLILLVAAFIGEKWKEVYDEALNNDYRFLSYGDSSLLLPTSLK